MLFYEDLVRKIEEEKIENIEKIEKFKLNGTKSLVGYGIAIPLILIGVIFLGIGLKQFKNVLTYSYIIDSDAKTLKFGKLNLQFDNVQTGTLKEMKLGKKVVTVIDMITNDKKQIVIPLFMAKQIRFILLIKEILAERFAIKK